MDDRAMTDSVESLSTFPETTDTAQSNTDDSPGQARESEPANAGESQAPIRLIEALLFAADAPLSALRLVELVGAGTPARMRAGIRELNTQYETWGVAFHIVEIANGFQMMTRPEYRPLLNKLNRQRMETRLTDATLETLAIVAYKQPIIRADIESIRGVACGEVLNRLREMGLLRIVGRADVVGRPMLYGTTKRFLDVFGLANLDDLPPMETLKLRPAAQLNSPGEPGMPSTIAVAGA